MKKIGELFNWSGEVEPAPSEKRHVFLSHASVDKEQYVYPFAAKLKQAGITYWLDDAEIKWGEQIAGRINNGLTISDFVVVFLSKAFIDRSWTESELFAALSIENEIGRCVVLPIVIGEPKDVLAGYPLLKSKKYKRWEEDLDILVAELGRTINPSDKSLLGFDPAIMTNMDGKIGQPLKSDKLELVVNDKGELCLLHDKRIGPTFGTIPFFALYHIDKRRLELIFNTGFTMPFDFVLSDEMHQSLLKEKKILMVRMNNEKAAEGFELALAKCKNGKIIDDENQHGKRYHFLYKFKKLIGKWK